MKLDWAFRSAVENGVFLKKDFLHAENTVNL